MLWRESRAIRMGAACILGCSLVTVAIYCWWLQVLLYPGAALATLLRLHVHGGWWQFMVGLDLLLYSTFFVVLLWPKPA